MREAGEREREEGARTKRGYYRAKLCRLNRRSFVIHTDTQTHAGGMELKRTEYPNTACMIVLEQITPRSLLTLLFQVS